MKHGVKEGADFAHEIARKPGLSDRGRFPKRPIMPYHMDRILRKGYDSQKSWSQEGKGKTGREKLLAIECNGCWKHWGRSEFFCNGFE